MMVNQIPSLDVFRRPDTCETIAVVRRRLAATGNIRIVYYSPDGREFRDLTGYVSGMVNHPDNYRLHVRLPRGDDVYLQCDGDFLRAVNSEGYPIADAEAFVRCGTAIIVGGVLEVTWQ